MWASRIDNLFFKDLFFNCYALGSSKMEGKGDRVEDLQPRTTGRNQTRVAEIRTGP